MGTRAGILLRLSEEKDTPEQTREAFERFEAACRRLCDWKGWEASEIYADGVVSAYKGRKREGFDAAMRALRDGSIDVLVVSDLDRLLRSWKDAATVDEVIRESGRTIVASDGRDVREDPYYPVHVGIAISESKRIGKRVKAQVAQSIEKGRPAPSPRAYGFERGGMVVRESEAQVIRDAVERLIAGVPLGAIVRDFRERGITGAGGRPFVATSLRNVVTNPRIAGIRVHRGKEVGPGTWEPIISERDLRRVQALFAERTNKAREAKGEKPYRPGRGRGKGRGYAYSGLLVCGVCGARLAGSSGAYRCQSCRKIYIQAELLEAELDRKVLDWIAGPTFAARVEQRVQALRAGDTTIDELESDRAELADYEALPERFQTDATRARTSELKARVQAAEARLAAAPEVAALIDLPTAEAELRALWASWTVEQRRAHLVAVLKPVTIRPATRRHVFEADRIDPPEWR
jgi:site-specific DNA recombinase